MNFYTSARAARARDVLDTQGSVQVRGLLGDGDRAALRLWLERELKTPVSMLQLGDTAIYEVV